MEIQTLKLKLKIASDKKKAQAKRKALDFSAEDFTITRFELESMQDWNGNLFWMGKFHMSYPTFDQTDDFIIYDNEGDCIRFQYDYPDDVLDQFIDLIKSKIKLLLGK